MDTEERYEGRKRGREKIVIGAFAGSRLDVHCLPG